MVMQETDKNMSSNTTEYVEREKMVIELSKQNKSTRYIAEARKISLRDIGLIRKNQGIVIIKDNGNKNNEKATQAYRFFSEGKKR